MSVKQIFLARAVLLAACNQPQLRQAQTHRTAGKATGNDTDNTRPDVMTLPVLHTLFYDPSFNKSLKDSLAYLPQTLKN